MNNSQRQAAISGQLAKVTSKATAAEKMTEAFAGMPSNKVKVINTEIALLAAYDRIINQTNLQRKVVLDRLQNLSIQITKESK
jgi:tmRNA-binding protein